MNDSLTKLYRNTNRRGFYFFDNRNIPVVCVALHNDAHISLFKEVNKLAHRLYFGIEDEATLLELVHYLVEFLGGFCRCPVLVPLKHHFGRGGGCCVHNFLD